MSVSQKFIDRTEELLHNTSRIIDSGQRCSCPMVMGVYLNYQFEYWYDGYKYNVWEDNVQVYAVNNIPYCYDNETKNTIYYDKLENLVTQDKVWPFLLFINGHVIPWSQITIIKDYDYSYIRIDGEIDDFSESAKMIYFPISSKHIRYGEDDNYSLDPSIHGLYFGEDKYLLESPEFQKLSVRFEFQEDIYFRMVRSSHPDFAVDTKKYIEFVGLEKGKTPTTEHIILFNGQGSFLGQASKWVNYVEDPLRGTYTWYQVHDEFIDQNGFIILMYFNGHTNSVSHAYARDIDKEKAKNFLRNKSGYSNIQKSFTNQFDFGLYREFTYDRNIRSSMKYITQYDYSLWNKVFIDESPIKSFRYTGREFKNLSDLKSYVRFSRRHSSLIEDVVMMFVNGKIYEHSIDISYTNNTINIPAFGILDEDRVEIVLFEKCNNNILNIVIPNQDTAVYIHPEYNLKDCYIMDDQSSLVEFPNVPDSPEGRKQYVCNIISYSADDNSNYKINFEDTSHYGRRLKVVPKNQFRYYKYRNVEGQNKILLPQQFNYCHDIDRYMVFVNGCKIDKTEYTVTIMNQYRPFDELVLYISTILEKDDRVDVFYVPEYLEEKYREPKTSLKGTILLRANYPKMYALSRNTNMVFVNGVKIHPDDIVDIDMNKIVVSTKYNEIHNVTVIEYIKGSEEVAKYLLGMDGTVPLAGDILPYTYKKDLKDICVKATGNSDASKIGVEDNDFSKYVYDRWTEIIDFLITWVSGKDTVDDSTEEERDQAIEMLYTLFPALNPASINPDYKQDYAALKAILYDIIIDFYLQRNEVRTGEVFPYDFEIDQWLEDALGNQDITLYPDHDKLLDYFLTLEQARPKDVKDPQMYKDI